MRLGVRTAQAVAVEMRGAVLPKNVYQLRTGEPSSRSSGVSKDRNFQCPVYYSQIVNRTVGIMEQLGDVECRVIFAQVRKLYNSAKLKEIKDYGWNVTSDPWKHRSGGGIGDLYRPDITLNKPEDELEGSRSTSHFKSCNCSSRSSGDMLRLVNIYRPPYTKKAKYTESFFLDELDEYLSRKPVHRM